MLLGRQSLDVRLRRGMIAIIISRSEEIVEQRE